MNNNDRPPREAPPLPQRPAEPQKSRGSIWPVLIAGAVGLFLFVGFSLLAAPLVGVAVSVGVVFALFCLVAIAHYLLWGYWLGDSIRREVEEEEERNRSPDEFKSG